MTDKETKALVAKTQASLRKIREDYAHIANRLAMQAERTQAIQCRLEEIQEQMKKNSVKHKP